MKKFISLATIILSSVIGANAQNCPSVNVTAANQNTASVSNYSFSSTGKTVGFYKNGSSDVVVSGTITFQNNDTLYIGPGVQFNPSNINNFGTGCRLIICGSASMTNSYTLNGGVIDNYGTMTINGLNVSNFTLNNNANLTISNSMSAQNANFYNHGSFSVGSININSGASIIYNYNDGTWNMTQSFQLQTSGSVLTNEGVMNFASNFNTASNTTVLNKGRLYTATDFTVQGTLDNYGMWISNGYFTVNGGATVRNFCRLVNKMFQNSNGNTQNYGMIWTIQNQYGAFTNNSNLTNAGYIRTTTFQNSATITNAANNAYTNNTSKNGYIRIDGGSNSNESQNNGTIAGGFVADIYNAAQSPAYKLDYAGSSAANMTATLGNINAYDTTTFLNQNFPSSCVEMMVVKGTAWQDANNNANNTNNVYAAGKKGINTTSSPVYALLYAVDANGNATGTVVAATQLASDGSYTFPAKAVAAGPYKIMLSTTSPGVGGAIPAAGSVPSTLYATSPLVSSTQTAGGIIDFGIENRPTNTNVNSSNVIPNVVTGNQAPTLIGTDAEDGAIGSGGKFQIVTLPSNATLKYNGVNVVAGQIISSYNPSLLKVYPASLAPATVEFTYKAIDAAGAASNSASNAKMGFGIVLPVKLISFTGVSTDTYNELNWTIVAENAKSVTLEFSADAKNFSDLNTNEIGGNIENEQAYSFRHTEGLAAVNYYRLRFEDIDGKVAYSNVVVLKSDVAANASVSFYPNPFQSSLNVSVTLANAENVQVVMMDLGGRVIKNMNVNGAAGTNNITINDVQNLTPGMYIVNVVSGDVRNSFKVTKN